MELNRIYNTDCLSFLRRMDDECIDLVVTSPPYNKNAYAAKSGDSKSWGALRGRQIAYDAYDDDMSPEEYEQWQKDILSECMRVLKPSGSVFYNHKDVLVHGRAVSPKWVYEFNLHQQIIWNRGSSLANDPHYFQPITEYVYWMVKDPKSFYFDKSKAYYRTTVWDIDLGKVLREKNSHPAPFPVILAENCVACACPMGGGVVFDPFMGSGTTAIAALKQKCNYVGTELSDSYCKDAEKRIKIHNCQLELF